jgi:nucleoid-associated protein YgaU
MIGKDSRYAKSVLYTGGGEEFLGARPRIDTSPRPDDRFHTVKEGDRIDLIAFSYLGDAALWWIVCDYNDIFYPLELEVGAVLRIPSPDHLQMRLLS